MSVENDSESARTLVVKELLNAAKDSEDLKLAGKKMGRSLATIATTIENALIPLAALNFGIQKAKEYFSEKFSDEFSRKIGDIPPEYLVEPKTSVAGPALQGLAFSLDEPNLKELYLNLLKTSVDGREVDKAHPSYVEIIKQISSAEVAHLNNIMTFTGSIAIARFKQNYNSGGFVIIDKYVMQATSDSDGSQAFAPELEYMIENWIRLGLINVDFMRKRNDDSSYAWVEENPRFISLKSKDDDSKNTSFDMGIYEVTAFGSAFASAVGIGVSRAI